MTADRVFRNGRVFTANPDRPFVTGLAVGADRVVAVGDDLDLDPHVTTATDVVDLQGRLLTPGFIDAHVHPGQSGLDLLRVDFGECGDGDDALTVIAEYASANSGLEWVTGAGWSQAWFQRGCPEKVALDRAVPDRPAILWNADGHSAWVNSRALDIAGIDNTTPDPVDGRIERLPDGSPQGTLHEGAVKLVEHHLPADTAAEIEAGLIRGQRELIGYGVTGWQDAHVDPQIQATYLEIARDGRLKGRVVGALWWDRARGLEQIDELVERRHEAAPRFRPISVKLMLDGVAENFTASMLDPWLGDDGLATDNHGMDFIDPEQLDEIVARLDRLGFQCHFHVIGDRAVRNALDAVENARVVNGPSDLRHHLAHIQVVHPDDIPRFASLEVVANAQPLWACRDYYQEELTIPFLGPERAGWQYPFGSLLTAGAKMAMGSDWGVSTCNVMEQVEMAVTRTGDTGSPLIATERLTPLQALSAFTTGSAHVNHAETETGSIAVGKLADLVVFDRDPFRDGGFAGAIVETTIIGGEVVYAVGVDTPA